MDQKDQLDRYSNIRNPSNNYIQPVCHEQLSFQFKPIGEKKPFENVIHLGNKLQEKNVSSRLQKIKRLRQKFIRHAEDLDWRK